MLPYHTPLKPSHSFLCCGDESCFASFFCEKHCSIPPEQASTDFLLSDKERNSMERFRGRHELLLCLEDISQ